GARPRRRGGNRRGDRGAGSPGNVVPGGGLAGPRACFLARRTHRAGPAAARVSKLFFTPGDSIGRLALSLKPMLADVYWIRAVQYFGSTRLDAKRAAETGTESTSHYDPLYP